MLLIVVILSLYIFILRWAFNSSEEYTSIKWLDNERSNNLTGSFIENLSQFNVLQSIG